MLSNINTRILPVLLILVILLSACVVPGAAPTASQPATAAPTEYVNAEVLVDTDWMLENLDNPTVRIIDVSSKLEDYQAGHIPNAVYINGGAELTNPEDSTQGQILTQDALSAVMSKYGINQDDTVVFYDGINNLWASRAYWVLKYYQHPDVRIYNGGSKKWVADGQELVIEEVVVTPSQYVANEADVNIRTTTEYVLEHIDNPDVVMCDARNPEEFTGTDVRAARGGHIPGAINIDWVNAVNSDGTFKDAQTLYQLYTTAGFVPDKQIITYCQTGVRGAHTWFVLRELLGFPDVRNYDGSWAEYGNMEDTPIES
jgi:thiosulfate/3-mercaptopyruvate sulfurtransferase